MEGSITLNLSYLDRLLTVNVSPVMLCVDPKNTLHDLKTPVFKNGKGVQMKQMLDPSTFPFSSYAVVNDTEHLDKALATIIREWIQRYSPTA